MKHSRGIIIVHRRSDEDAGMEAFLVTLVTVGLSEMGDKTQFVSLLLATRFPQPWSILLGMLLANLGTNAIAVFGGAWLRATFGEESLAWAVGILFIALALLALRANDDDEGRLVQGRNALVVSFLTLFVSNLGDKSQLVTGALAIKYGQVLPVMAGGTLGPVLVNLPVVFLGEMGAVKIPARAIRFTCAALFGALGLFVLVSGPLHL